EFADLTLGGGIPGTLVPETQLGGNKVRIEGLTPLIHDLQLVDYVRHSRHSPDKHVQGRLFAGMGNPPRKGHRSLFRTPLDAARAGECDSQRLMFVDVDVLKAEFG